MADPRSLNIAQPMQPAVDDPGGGPPAPAPSAEAGTTPREPGRAPSAEADTIDSMIRRMRSGPPTPYSQRRAEAQRKRALREAKEQGSLIADAISTEWVGAWLSRQYRAGRFAANPSFELDAERLRSIQSEWALDDDQVERLAGEAVSEDHLQLLIRQMDGVNDARERLAARGFSGALATLGAAVTDPVALTLDAVTWGATAPLTRGTKATRLAHAWRAGLAAGASNGAVEGYLASVDDSRGFTDVLLAATGGLAIGGGLGAAFGPALQSRLDKAMASVRRQVLSRELAEGGVLEITEKGRRLGFTAEATLEERRAVVSALMMAENARATALKGSGPRFAIDGAAGGVDPVRGGGRLYRETSLADAAELFPTANSVGGRPFGDDETFAATVAELALGQGDNRGVLVEIDPSGLRVTPSRTAGQSDELSSLGTNVVIRHSGPEGLRGNVVAVTVKPGAKGDAVARRRFQVFARAAVKRGWRREELADGGVRYFDPKAQSAGDVSAVDRADSVSLAGLPGSGPVFSASDLSPESLNEIVSRFSDEAADLVDRFGDGRRVGDSAFDASKVGEEVPRSRFGAIRFGLAGRLGRSEVPEIRRVGAMLVEDAIPRLNADGSPRPVDQAATVWVRRMQQREMAEFNRAALPAFEEWKKARGKSANPLKHFDLLDEFFTEVGLAVRRGGALAGDAADGRPIVGDLVQWESQGSLRFPEPRRVTAIHDGFAFVDGSTTGIPIDQVRVVNRAGPVSGPDDAASGPVNRMAQQFASQMDRMRIVGKRYGVKGFENLESDPRYFTRMPSGQKISDAIRRAGRTADESGKAIDDFKRGTAEVEEMIAEARRRAEMRLADELGVPFDAERFSDENLRTFARGYLRMIDQGDQDGRYFQYAELFSGRLDARGEDMMRKAGISEADIAHLRDIMETDELSRGAEREAEKGSPPIGKRRTLLDEEHTHTAANGEVLTMDDLYERNAVRVMEVYSRQLYGSAAGRNIIETMAAQTGEKIESFDDLLRVLQDRAAGEGASSAAKAKNRRDIQRLDAGWRAMMNWRQPSVLDAETARIVQELRSYNFIRLMGQMGFAQVAEVGTVLAEVGLSSMMQQMPALRQLYSRAKSGTLTNEYLASLEQITGLGTHRLNGRVISRLDQTDPGFEQAGGRLRRLMERGRHLVADVSGLNAINQALYRSFVMAQPQKWHAIAVGKAARPSDARLALIGMTPERFDAMLGEIREHAVTTGGELGGRITDLRLDRWDRAVLEDFSETLHRIGTRVVQENDIGQMAAWMNGDLGKTLMQFKSFITAAYEKQLLAGLATRDFEVFAAFGYSTLLAGLAYMAQQQLIASGRDDAEELLEERLAPGAIAAAAFSRAGYASIIPGTIDTALTTLGLDKKFDFGRSSGLASDFWAGNAVVDSIDKAARVPGSIRSMIDAGTLTQDDMRRIKSVLPFQNAMGIGQILDLIASAGEEPQREASAE